jgi:hypothetical protein
VGGSGAKEESFLDSPGFAKYGWRIKRMLLLELKDGKGGESKTKRGPESVFS